MDFASNTAKILTNLVCVIDANQHENMLEALSTGYRLTMEQTDISHIAPAKENDEFDVVI